MSPKKVLTNKLFYKKYPYRITCGIQGCWLIRSYGWDQAKQFAIDGTGWHFSNWRPKVDGENLNEFITVIDSYRDTLKFRFEHDYFDIYLEEENQYNNLQQLLARWIQGLSEPEDKTSLNFLKEEQNSRKVICNKLPHGKYRYKIHLRYRTSIDLRKNFKNWITNYADKIRVPHQTLEWMEYESRWQWCPFMYVEDQGTLSMVCLFLGGSVYKIEEFIPKRSINTTL